MKQEVVWTNNINLEQAVIELVSKLKSNPKNYSVILFFVSSSYDFSKVSKLISQHFPHCPVAGTSTAGEITQAGFLNDSIVLTALQDTKTRVSGILIEYDEQNSASNKEKIAQAAVSNGITLHVKGANTKHFALSFITGLKNVEEFILALLYDVIGDTEFDHIGGSSGDDFKFEKTFISLNGEICEQGAVILFFKTDKKFDIRKENIFEPTGISMVITGFVPETRTITSIDGQNPQKRYAELLKMSESEVIDIALHHPLGRVYGESTFISSIANFNEDGTINLYSKILKGSTVYILKPSNLLQTLEDTSSSIKEKISNPGFVYFVNCAHRTMVFEQKEMLKEVSNQWNKHFPLYCGFSSYGEQCGRMNSNQTLVSLVISK